MTSVWLFEPRSHGREKEAQQLRYTTSFFRQGRWCARGLRSARSGSGGLWLREWRLYFAETA